MVISCMRSLVSRGQTLFAQGVITCSISTRAPLWSMGAYTASDNALRGRGSGHARLCVLGLLFGNTAAVKIVTRHVRCYIIFTSLTWPDLYFYWALSLAV